MSTQFAPNEKIFAHYDYAAYGYRKKLSGFVVSKSLTVTNKRVIHKEESNKLGKTLLVQREIPLENAKFVDVAMSKTIKFAFLVWSLIFGALAALAFVFPNQEEILPNVPYLFPLVGGVLALIAFILLICFLCSFSTYLSFSIEVDCMKTPTLSYTSKTIKTKKVVKTPKNLQLSVNVNSKVAHRMAAELGAMILAAKDYCPEEEVVEEPVEVVEETAEITEETAEATEETVEATEETVEATEETVEAIEETAETVEETAEATEETAEATTQIAEATEAIEEATEEIKQAE